jgi:predicted TIM-barrel fold metal-dependent hydrolase
MKIDIFPHILTPKYLNALREKTPSDLYEINKQVEQTPGLSNLELRLGVLDKFADVTQILNIAGPAIETVVGPKDAVELCKLANDEMAELLVKHADRFVGAVACLPMNDIDAALQETDRAIRDLAFRGVQIYSNINGEPLDTPKFRPLYEKMADYNLPILIHPRRDRSIPDYPGEPKSRYGAYVVFGWPYETTLAMSRLVYSGILEDYPNLKFITHHCGGMVPYFDQRIKGNFDYNEVSLGMRFRRPLQASYRILSLVL